MNIDLFGMEGENSYAFIHFFAAWFSHYLLHRSEVINRGNAEKCQWRMRWEFTWERLYRGFRSKFKCSSLALRQTTLAILKPN